MPVAFVILYYYFLFVCCKMQPSAAIDKNVSTTDSPQWFPGLKGSWNAVSGVYIFSLS